MGFRTGEALRQKVINENANPFRRFDARDRVSLITAFAAGQINGFGPFSAFWRERLEAVRCAVGLGLLKTGDAETEVSCKAQQLLYRILRSGPRWARSGDACAACCRARTQSCRSCGSDETIGGPPPRISAPSWGRFLLAYFVFPLEQRCSIENGSAVTRQRFDNLVRKMSSCGRFAVI